MAAIDPAKDPATPGETKPPQLPPIPPERVVNLPCGACGWNAWVSIPTPVRELYYDSEEKTGAVRSTQFNLIVCSGCSARLILTKGDDGTLQPSFDLPKHPLYRDALSGRVTVGQ